MSNTDDAVRDAAALLAAASEVTLLAHVQPDADSLGSALALGIALHRRGTAVRVSFAAPDEVPDTLRPLDVSALLVPPSEVPAAPELLVACDAAEPARLGALADRLATAGTTIMIDHHVSNPGFGDVEVLVPGAEATVLLVHRILTAMGAELDIDIARCLYAGLVTDTRGFRTAGAAAHRVAAALLETGLEPEPLIRPMMDTHPHAWLRVLGAALQRCVLEPAAAGGLGLAYTVIPAADVARFRIAETDSVVDVVRTSAEAEVAAVLKQVGERMWTCSLRSKGAVDVAAAAAVLGGGGHRMAAGFSCVADLDAVLVSLRAALCPMRTSDRRIAG